MVAAPFWWITSHRHQVCSQLQRNRKDTPLGFEFSLKKGDWKLQDLLRFLLCSWCFSLVVSVSLFFRNSHRSCRLLVPNDLSETSVYSAPLLENVRFETARHFAHGSLGPALLLIVFSLASSECPEGNGFRSSTGKKNTPVVPCC